MFQITLNEKLVKRIVSGYIADQLEDYTDKDFKAVGLPTRRQLVEQLLADERFQKALAKKLSVFVNDGDLIHDALQDMGIDMVGGTLKKLPSAFDL